MDDNDVCVRISGPDAKGTKRAVRPFFTSDCGRTSLSASGIVLRVPGDPLQRRWLLTSAGVLAPFMLTFRPEKGSGFVEDRSLISGTVVEIRTDHPVGWIPLQSARVAVLDVPHFRGAVREIAASLGVEARGVPFGALAVIALPNVAGVPCGRPIAQRGDVNHIAALCVRGSPTLVVSSPYGLVAPRIFANSWTSGVVANASEQRGGGALALLLVDNRCLSGSEGGTVRSGAAGEWIGVVAPALPPFLRPRVAPPGGERSASPPPTDGTAAVWTPPRVAAAAREIDQLTAIVPLGAFARQLRRHLERECTSGRDDEQGVAASAGRAGSALARVRGGEDAMETRDAGAGLGRGRGRGRSLGVELGSGLSGGLARAAALSEASVALIRVRGSETWGSGVVATRRGHVVTCAHLFDGVPPGQREADVLVTLCAASGAVVTSGATEGAETGATQRCWRRARVLDKLTCDGALDLVVLKIDLCGGAEPSAPLSARAVEAPGADAGPFLSFYVPLTFRANPAHNLTRPPPHICYFDRLKRRALKPARASPLWATRSSRCSARRRPRRSPHRACSARCPPLPLGTSRSAFLLRVSIFYYYLRY